VGVCGLEGRGVLKGLVDGMGEMSSVDEMEVVGFAGFAGRIGLRLLYSL
jgi:hypothetical protein